MLLIVLVCRFVLMGIMLVLLIGPVSCVLLGVVVVCYPLLTVSVAHIRTVSGTMAALYPAHPKPTTPQFPQYPHLSPQIPPSLPPASPANPPASTASPNPNACPA